MSRPQFPQRREYFRMAVPLAMLVPTVPEMRAPRHGVPFLAPLDDGSDYRLLRVVDLSAGGCCCEVPPEWPPVGARLPGYLYLSDGRSPLTLDLLVLRREESDLESARAAFTFLQLRERNRERILRALFREYRRQRRPVSST